MAATEFSIHPLGDSAATIDLGKTLDRRNNELALSIAESLRSDPFAGFIESAIGMASVTCYYDPIAVRRGNPGSKTAFDYVSDRLRSICRQPFEYVSNPTMHVIPFRVGGEFSPDLRSVGEQTGMTTAEVLDIFTSREYRVYMLGFLPGFAYMGEVDDRIAMPRLATPRLDVAAGSVAIAGNQAGIYPVDSSGGWNLIGRTDIKPFDRSRDEHFLFRPGDNVRFEIV